MLGGMIIVFEVHLDPNRSSDDFLSEDLLEETQAQVMTPLDTAPDAPLYGLFSVGVVYDVEHLTTIGEMFGGKN